MHFDADLFLNLPRSQPTVPVFSPYVFGGGHGRNVFLKMWGGRGKSSEGVRQLTSLAQFAQGVYVARTPRLAVSGCVHRTLRTW